MKSDYVTLAVIEAQLREAAERRREAGEIYTRALQNAFTMGMSNTKIARIVGVSETAIRNWRKRH